MGYEITLQDGTVLELNRINALLKMLEEITNNFYKHTPYYNSTKMSFNEFMDFLNKQEVTTKVRFITEGFESAAYSFSDDTILISKEIIEAFNEQNLPCFSVFYHELGHVLYTGPLQELLDRLKSLRNKKYLYSAKIQNIIIFMDSYFHLLNWIEDYYIEDKLIENYDYLTDILTCVKRCDFKQDLTKKEYAFHYYYKTKKPSPALTIDEQETFLYYVTRLLNLRECSTFGNTSLIPTKSSNVNFQFLELIFDFQKWCTDVGIFDSQVNTPPPLPLPNIIHVKNNKGVQGSGIPTIGGGVADSEDEEGEGDGGEEDTDEDSDDGTEEDSDSDSDSDEDEDEDADEDKGIEQTEDDMTKLINKKKKNLNKKIQGQHTKHSHKVGVTRNYILQIPIVTNKEIFKESLQNERTNIDAYYHTLVQEASSQEDSKISTLFTPRLKDTSIIQNKVNIKNFFNPNRLIDQVLFKQQTHTYMNASVYRDISGSTYSDPLFSDINDTCKYLIDNIPVETHFYLYSSGYISILETQYVDWSNWENPPSLYSTDPTFKQFEGGTNSSAIADVITEQLDDKWLNIIVTDGDLDDLLARKNIEALLKNVFVIIVGRSADYLSKRFQKFNFDSYCFVKDSADIPTIAGELIKHVRRD